MVTVSGELSPLTIEFAVDGGKGDEYLIDLGPIDPSLSMKRMLCVLNGTSIADLLPAALSCRGISYEPLESVEARSSARCIAREAAVRACWRVISGFTDSRSAVALRRLCTEDVDLARLNLELASLELLESILCCKPLF